MLLNALTKCNAILLSLFKSLVWDFRSDLVLQEFASASVASLLTYTIIEFETLENSKIQFEND